MVKQRNWLSDAPLATWHGINTDASGRVTRLALTDNRLSGEIPPELGSLANLINLQLADNHLSGPMPAELGSLAYLGNLSLDSNQLSGPIPPEQPGDDFRALQEALAEVVGLHVVVNPLSWYNTGPPSIWKRQRGNHRSCHD